MKVLFLNYEYPPLGGGAATATFYILHEFAKINGLEVDLVTSSIDSEYHQEKISGKVTIHKLPIGKNKSNLHLQSQKDLLVWIWKAYFFSRKLIKKNHYDLTHSFFTVPCGFLSWLFKMQFKVPYIVSLRGSDVPGYSDRFTLIYAFLKPLFRSIWKGAKFVISNSQGLRELALKTNPRQEIGIIYNGIDTQKFHPEKKEKNSDKFIITPGASRLTDRKGLKYLIEAVGHLLPKYPQISLKIMGDGNAREALQKLAVDLNISNKVKFIGRVERENTPPYYQEADVFVLPSLNEGMSNAMLEALASGLPIVATDSGGTKELVAEGQNGYIIKMKDSADIAEKLEKIINDNNLRRMMGEKSRQKALEMSWEKVAGKYYNTYQKSL